MGLTLCNPMDSITPGFPVPHYLLEFAQLHVHLIGDAIQPFHPLMPSFPSALKLSQKQGLFQWCSCSHQLTKIKASAWASVLLMNIQGWFPLRLTGLISLLSKELSGVFSSTTVQRHQFFGPLPSLQSSSPQPYMTTRKTIVLTILTFVCRVIYLLFNTLYRSVIPFLPRSNCLLIMAVVTGHNDFKAKVEEICHCFHLFPFYLPWSNGAKCHDPRVLIVLMEGIIIQYSLISSKLRDTR